MALTQVDPGLLSSTSQYTGFKNRIINGAMMIDQRNAGAASASSINGYLLDRWYVQQAGTTGKLIAQQNAGSITPPAGFPNYLGVTSQSAYTVGSGERYSINQAIEGFNFADLAWGTASAATVTLSFWVRSSQTGTFGGCIQNYAGNRSYPFSYTISSANTWEQKTITIAGDTSGTWVGATNAGAAYVVLSLGAGSTYQTTANAWAAGNYQAPTGATSVVGTNGATFYITGVQLEKGSTATSFDYRPYGTELQMCMRYYENVGVAGAGDISMNTVANGAGWYITYNFPFAVPKRATPTVTKNGTWSVGNTGQPGVNTASISQFSSGITSSGAGGYSATNSNAGCNFSASAEL